MKKRLKHLLSIVIVAAIVAMIFLLKPALIGGVNKNYMFQQFNSKQIILEDLSTGEILLERKIDKQVAIASLTKIMTAYILLDRIQNLDDMVTMDGSVMDKLSVEGASLSGFLPNEVVTIRDLAYAILLPSGGDAAIITANYLTGSEENFVELMNQYASQLEMTNTHFENATGLDSPNHYSTVDDLRKLLHSALENGNFYAVFTKFDYYTGTRTLNPDGYYLSSTLLKEGNNLTIKSGEIIGGKTGFTENAGLCLASIAQIGEKKYLLITTGAKGDLDSEQFNVTDAKSIFNSLAE